MKAERRFIRSEVRAIGGDSPKIVGHAAKFNVRSLDLGGFVEIIAPGAFDECLAQSPDIVGLWNHDDNIVLGRTTSGTMRVSVDSEGVRYEIDPPDTQAGRDAMVTIGRGDVTASSFGFFCLDDDWSIDPETDQLVRTLRKCAIFDCSPVTWPAYPDADAGVRALLIPGEMRSAGPVDAELISTLAERRQALQQGDRAALEDLEWHLRAHELLNAAARF